MNMKKIVLLICATMMMSGCYASPKTYAYLMAHPETLKLEVLHCHGSTTMNQTYCDMVDGAAHDFDTLYSQWRIDPEGFGKRILALEMQGSDVEELVKDDHFSEQMNQKEIVATYLAVLGINPVG